MTKALSPAQQDLLDAMKAGAHCQWLLPVRGGAYYFRSDTMKPCTAQARVLLKRGLVEVYEEDWRGHKLRIKK